MTAADHHRQVADALTRLLQAGEHSFVIVKLAGTGKFVQFVAPADDWLMLDVPEQSLSQEERRRAEAFFADIGEFDYELQAFCAVLTEGPQAAASVALDALRAVYQAPPDAAINIEVEFAGGQAQQPAAPGAGVCSVCGEVAESLTRRLWFGNHLAVGMIEAEGVCASCLSACRRRARIHLAVLGAVLLAAVLAVVAATMLVP